MPETPQDVVREILVRATGLIPNESIAGGVFAALLIVTDHVFNLLGE